MGGIKSVANWFAFFLFVFIVTFTIGIYLDMKAKTKETVEVWNILERDKSDITPTQKSIVASKSGSVLQIDGHIQPTDTTGLRYPLIGSNLDSTDQPGFPDKQILFEVVSDSTNDSAYNSGARTMWIYGVDGNWDLVSEVLTLNGTSPVQTANAYLRINSAVVRECGVLGRNDGTISITAVDAPWSSVYKFEIAPTKGVMSAAVFSVPAGYRAVLINFSGNYTQFGFAGLIQTEVELWSRSVTGLRRFHDKVMLNIAEVKTVNRSKPLIAFGSKTDVWLATRSWNAGARINGSMQLLVAKE